MVNEYTYNAELPEEIEKNINGVMKYLLEEMNILKKLKSKKFNKIFLALMNAEHSLSTRTRKSRSALELELKLKEVTVALEDVKRITDIITEFVSVIKELLLKEEKLLPARKKEIEEFIGWIDICGDNIHRILSEELPILIEGKDWDGIRNKIEEAFGSPSKPGLKALSHVLWRLSSLIDKLKATSNLPEISSVTTDKQLSLALKKAGFDVKEGHLDKDYWLMEASKVGNFPIVRLLLRMGANVYAPGVHRRMTPFQRATEGGHFEICELLLNSANPPPSETIMRDCVDLAYANGYIRINKLFRKWIKQVYGYTF